MPEPRDFHYDDGKAACLGCLNGKGMVTFAIQVLPDSPMRGTDLFNMMMDSFGDDVETIQGVWVKGHQGKASINIDKINELTLQKKSIEEAALETWTVTRAKKRGFLHVRVEHQETLPKNWTPEQIAGKYERIVVNIQR